MYAYTRLARSLHAFLSSNWFFLGIVAIFTISSLWVAVFSLYPMAFDEDFHMGLIKIYASSWLPYGIEPTRDMAVYGTATADPSYLWHYLLSFPYRLMELLGWNERSIVTSLRIINVAVVVAALFVYRKTFVEAGFGKAKSNLTIAFFTIIPVFPVLTGQVNYDNPLILLVGLSFLLALRWQRKLRTNKQIPAVETWLLLIVMLFAASIKYVYFAFAAGIIIWLGLALVQQSKRLDWKGQWRRFILQTKKISRGAMLLGVAAILLGSFFSARYITNYTTYGSPMPDCEDVFDEKACLDFGPWGRNFNLAKNLSPSFTPQPIHQYFVREWLPGMSQRLTFAVAGPTNSYQSRKPLPSLSILLTSLTILGCVAVLLTLRRVIKNPVVSLTLIVSAIYVGILVVKLYGDYATTGAAVAINGRYLLPLLPLVGVCFVYSASLILNRLKLGRHAGVIGLMCLIGLVLAGGGISTYVVLAEPQWYW